MSKEEQIALELTKTFISNQPKDTTIIGVGVVETYLEYLDKLREIKEKTYDLEKMQDEIGTYRYIINGIKNLIEKDGNNYVIKEELEELIKGVFVND